VSDRLSGTDEGTKTEFNATEAMIEEFCRSIIGRGGRQGRQTGCVFAAPTLMFSKLDKATCSFQ
jgi:hypothetical protein